MDEESHFGFLTRKVGPLQVWVWGLMIVGAYYWYTHYGPGAAANQPQPQTVDVSAQLDSQPQYGGSKYKTNGEWLDAAINYLVGESVPPDEASAALYNYLHSKVLTTQEQKDVNLAIEGIGPPPDIPAPAKVPPPPKPKHHKHHHGKSVPDKFPQGAPTSQAETLSQASTNYKTPQGIVVKMNPGLKKYEGNKRKIPKGTRIRTNV